MPSRRTSDPTSVVHRLGARDLLGLVEDVCRHRGVTVVELCGRTRTRAVARARQEVWWKLRHDPERHFSLQEIGALFARDHTTVRHGVEAHRLRCDAALTRTP
jgi:chromosomal replication initiation ATPase DnaA